MQVGIGMPNTLAGANRENLLTWSRLADAGPFSTLAAFDRLAYDSFEPMVTLGAAAAVTERIGLATMIIISPLRRAAMLAKAAASIQALSNGRFTLGVAVGARREDYETAGVPYHRRGAILTRQLNDLLGYWENENLSPESGAAGAPRLLVGGSNDIAFARTARYADGYMHGGGPPRAFARMADKARSAWRDAGRPGLPRLWGMGYFAFGDRQTLEEGAEYLRHYYAFTGPFAETIAQGLLTTPQAVHQFRRGYAEVGCDELVLFPTSADPGQVERLAEIIG